jgi:hypothetical protein
VARSSIAMPAAIARRRNRVLRPRDALSVYAHPRAEIARLTSAGALQRLATGYYAVAPLDRLGDPSWHPDLNAVALGIAQADYGVDAVALMGVSAARIHGAIPRALALAAVATPKQRPRLETAVGLIGFAKRDVGRLDLQRIDTELTSGWMTTIEQTLLDLASASQIGGLSGSDASEAIRSLGLRTNWDLLERLAREQHRPSGWRRALEIGGPDAG